MFKIILYFAVLNNIARCLQVQRIAENMDYYWRDYTGAIPRDALLAGKSSNGTNVYIGQTYVSSGGIISAQINPGNPVVNAVMWNAPQSKNAIKILCGPQTNFYWSPINSNQLHDYVNSKPVVIGGFQEAVGNLYVGRIRSGNGIKVGKIHETADVLYVVNLNKLDNQIDTYRDYEILTYSAPYWLK